MDNENKIIPLVEKVLTKAEQDALTPHQVIQSLKDGNRRFVNNDLTARDHTAQVRKAVHGQYPKVHLWHIGPMPGKWNF